MTIKTLRTTLATMAAVCALVLSSSNASGHYNPRGIFGGTIVCGTHHDGMAYLGTADGGVYVSTSNLLTAWRLRAVGLKDANIQALMHSGEELYVATADSGVYIFNGSAGGNDLFWNDRNNGLSDRRTRSLLAIDANTLLVGTHTGLFRSTNAGENWSAVSSALLDGNPVVALAMADMHIYCATENGGVFQSMNGGLTWSVFNDGNTSVPGTKQLDYNADTDQLVVLNSNGLYLLANASTNMMPAYTAIMEGIPAGTEVRYIANNGTAWYIATNAGVHSRAAADSEWAPAGTGLPTDDVLSVVAMPNTILAGTFKTGVFKASVNTMEWEENNSNMSNVHAYSVACWGDSMVVSATEQGLLISTDLGVTYEPVSGLADSENVNDVMFVGDMLFAATTNAGVFMSADFGATWTAQNGGLPQMNVRKLFASHGFKYAITANGQVLRAPLASATWEAFQSGLPSGVQPTSMAFHGNRMFVGTLGQGVYARKLSDSAWGVFNAGLVNLNVTSMTASAGKVYAGTDGLGVWWADADNYCQCDEVWYPANPIALDHFNLVPLDASRIVYVHAFAGKVLATFRGGVALTLDEGNSWLRGGHQFHLPSYSTFQKLAFNSRAWLSTETNSTQTNSLGEFAGGDPMLVVHTGSVSALAEGTTSFHDITSNGAWEVASGAAWVTVSNTEGLRNGELTLTVAANPMGSPRSTQVTVTSGDIVRTIDVEQEGLTSILEQLAAQVRIMPNPNDGRFRIDAGDGQLLSAELMDLSGRVVLELPVRTSGILDVDASVNSGAYLLRLRFAEGLVTRTIVVQ